MGRGQGEPTPLSTWMEEKEISGRNGSNEQSHITRHNHTDASSSASSNISLLEEGPTPVPCEAGVVEPAILTQVPESEEQRNEFQKVIFLIRRENGLTPKQWVYASRFYLRQAMTSPTGKKFTTSL